MAERFRVSAYGNAVANDEPREYWSWAVVPNEENLIGLLDCESEEDANLLCKWLNDRDVFEEALRKIAETCELNAKPDLWPNAGESIARIYKSLGVMAIGAFASSNTASAQVKE